MGAAGAMAMPASPMPGSVVQPDGTVLSVQLHGDEFMHFTTTADGYTVLRQSDGRYVYAVRGEQGLEASTVTARDASARTAAELSWLTGVERMLQPGRQATQAEMENARRAKGYGLASAPNYDYNNFHGLVLLVEYADCPFKVDNPHTVFGDMVTAHNYSGWSGSPVYTGSVRDYFYDNSMHKFDPSFDVVGPVKITKSQYYVNGTENIRDVIREALQKADPDINYKTYDGDNDGVVDMFYVIFAGGGSNFSGNDPRLVWPHAWAMGGDIFDGVSMGRYACSTELYGPPSWNMTDGIGTICHEFSHVLGLMDEYDTDYGGGGGLSAHPGEYSLMASGGYLNYSRTPCGYTLMQRCQSGFTVPEEITAAGEYTLQDIDLSNHGYRISSPDRREYFLLENRGRTKWNAYTNGTGMLVHRVDSTNTAVWSNNTINSDPSHNYYTMLRAHAIAGNNVNNSVLDHDGDPFPGSYGVTEINYDTDPSLLVWSGKGADFILEGITQESDGTVRFRAVKAELDDLYEGFENVETTGKYQQQAPGEFCNWSFYNAQVDEGIEGFREGNRAAALYKGGYVESSPIVGKTKSISMTVYNPTSRAITFNVRYNTGGNNWDYLYEPGGMAGISVSKGESVTPRFDIPADAQENLRFQVKMANNTGSTTEKVYVDGIHAVQDAGTSGVEQAGNTDESPLRCRISGGSVVVSGCSGNEAALYDLSGRCVARTTVSATGTAVFSGLPRGVYIASDGLSSVKVLL